MIALSFNCAARLKIAKSSAFCSAEERSFREGQSMFATVATHAARNSRAGAGGTSWDGVKDCARHSEAKAIIPKAKIRLNPAILTNNNAIPGGRPPWERSPASGTALQTPTPKAQYHSTNSCEKVLQSQHGLR